MTSIVLVFFVCVLITNGIIAFRSQEKDHPVSASSIPAISKVWIINLQSRSERMEFMSRQMRNLKIPFERFEAFDFGNGSDSKTLEASQRLHPNTKINLKLVGEELSKPVDYTMAQSWGAVGCWQSHLQIFMEIAYGSSSQYPGPFLILEDDVKVTTSINKYLNHDYLNKILPNNWEMIYFDYLGLKCHDEHSSKHYIIHEEFCKINFTYATGGYVIRNKEVALKLIEAGNTAHLSIADKYTNPLFQTERIHAYAILEKVIHQLPRAFGSDIRTPAALVKTIEKFYSPKNNSSSSASLANRRHNHTRHLRKIAKP